MNKDINQKISQFLDNELAHTELDDFLLKIKKQPELKSKINRYQVMTQALKMEQVVLADGCFLDKINQELKQEPHHFLPQLTMNTARERQSNLWKKTSLAIAASVTFIAVIISQQNVMQSIDQPQQIAVAEKTVIEQPIVVAKSLQPSQHERFKAYLQAHNDDLYTHGSLNVSSLARVASYGQD